jgi:orotate phosphoribosyltransferase
MVSLLKLQLPTYEATECPMCKQGVPIYKPGSK